MQKIIVGGLLVVIILVAAAWALRGLWPSYMDRQPTLVEMAPLAPVEPQFADRAACYSNARRHPRGDGTGAARVVGKAQSCEHDGGTMGA